MLLVSFRNYFRLILITACAASALFAASAKADTTTTWGPARVLQEALSTSDHMNLFNDNRMKGFNLSGGLFSGRASGIDTTAKNYLSSSMNDGSGYDKTAELEGDQRVYAMMVDGRYEFDNDFGTGLAIHPYMSGGVGMAVYDAGNPSNALGPQGGDMVPLFRLGGGVAYDLSEKLNMSLDYRAGFSAGDSYLASHGLSNTDMQSINMGMHYRF